MMGMGSRSGGCCIMVWLVWAVVSTISSGEFVKVGVVFDPNTTVGILSNTSIQMALSDFYAENHKYKTRISFIFKDAGDVVEVASAATELLRDGVDAIIGPQTIEQAMYLTEFGRKYEIPIISFTATSPSLSPKQNPYFIRAVQKDSAQVGAINAIIQMYGWREIVPIYEDTEYGRGIIPYLADALQQNGTRLVRRTMISRSSTLAKTQKFQHFQAKFKQRPPLSLSLVQAYDTVRALAMAVEKVNQSTIPVTAIMKIKLRDVIRNTNFEGICGDFDLVDGELKRSTFEVFNVLAEKEIVIGNWTEGIPFSINQLKQPIWPGDTTNHPPMNLRVGIPIKRGFQEFVDTNINDPQNSSGFCIDIFLNAIQLIPITINYTFVPFMNQIGKSNGSYDELLQQIVDQKVDAVVGDITIVANRSQLVDFTLPYSQSGVTLLVSTQNDKDEDIWVFFMPFKLNLWIVSFIFFIFTGSVVWLLECRVNSEFGEGSPQQKIGLIFWFSLSTLVFAHREKVMNNLSRFVLIIWIFVVLILIQSYTANLSSTLTAQKLQRSYLDINEIKKNGYSVGFLNGSFVEDYLRKLGFSETQLKSYESPEEYKEALEKGTSNGGVAAIFDELPYIKVFLRKYPSGRFQTIGPVYRNDGFGFAFPKGSPLVSYFSRAILNVTENEYKMSKIEQEYFSNPDAPPIPNFSGSPLDVRRFGGLFIIMSLVNMLALLIYMIQFSLTCWPELTQSSFTFKMVEMVRLFYNLHFRSSSLQTTHSRVYSVPSTPHNFGIVNQDQMEHNAQTTQSGSDHSVSEIAESTTPSHGDSTEEPHNLGTRIQGTLSRA